MDFTHLDEKGIAKMVDISSKKVQHRIAEASGKIFLGEKILELIRNKRSKRVTSCRWPESRP